MNKKQLRAYNLRRFQIILNELNLLGYECQQIANTHQYRFKNVAFRDKPKVTFDYYPVGQRLSFPNFGSYKGGIWEDCTAEQLYTGLTGDEIETNIEPKMF